MIEHVLNRIVEGKDIDGDEMKEAAISLSEDQCGDILRGAFLTALYLKGYTSQEIRGFADGLMSFSSLTPYTHCTDIVGTGGDRKGTINVSTASAILCSSLGITMGKHGNRGVTGKSGGADFMEMSGYVFPKNDGEIRKQLEQNRFAFLLAPLHNPAFKNFGNVRKKLGHPTIFNLMGPLTNPLRPETRIIGCTSRDVQKIFAGAVAYLNARGFIITAEDGMDEISYASRSIMVSVENREREIVIDPQAVVGRRIKDEDTTGNSVEEIFFKTVSGLNGKSKDAADFICLNAAPCIIASGMADSFQSAFNLARKTISSGRAMGQFSKITGGRIEEVLNAV